jgi:hypothetical protein
LPLLCQLGAAQRAQREHHDAERQAGLPSSEQVSMRQEIEDDALSDKQAFCEENGRRLMLPDIPE